MPNQKEAFETCKAHTDCCLWLLELNNSKTSFHAIYFSINQTLWAHWKHLTPGTCSDSALGTKNHSHKCVKEPQDKLEGAGGASAWRDAAKPQGSGRPPWSHHCHCAVPRWDQFSRPRARHRQLLLTGVHANKHSASHPQTTLQRLAFAPIYYLLFSPFWKQ